MKRKWDFEPTDAEGSCTPTYALSGAQTLSFDDLRGSAEPLFDDYGRDWASDGAESSEHTTMAPLDEHSLRLQDIQRSVLRLKSTLKDYPTAPYFSDLLRGFEKLCDESSRRLSQVEEMEEFLRVHKLEPSACELGYFSVLPDELVLHVFSYLAPRELAAVSCCCRRFSRLSDDGELWRAQLIAHFPRAVLHAPALPFRAELRANCALSRHWKEGLFALRVASPPPFARFAADDDDDDLDDDDLDDGDGASVDGIFTTFSSTAPFPRARGALPFSLAARVHCLAFSAHLLVVGGPDASVAVARHGAASFRHLIGHTREVRCVDLGSDALKTLVASASRDGTARLWDAAGGAAVACLRHTTGVKCVRLAAGAVVTGADDGVVRVFDPRAASEAAETSEGDVGFGGATPTPTPTSTSTPTPTAVQLCGHRYGVTSLASAPSAPFWLLSGSRDRLLALWDVRMPTEPLARMRGHGNTVRCCALEGTRAVSGGWDEAVRVWDLEQEIRLSEERGSPPPEMHNLHRSGRPFDDVLLPKKHRVELKGHRGRVLGVAVCGGRVVSGSVDGEVRVWEERRGWRAGKMRAGTAPVVEVKAGETGVMAGSRDGTIAHFDFREVDRRHVSLCSIKN